MRRKKSTAMFPKERPDLLTIRAGQIQLGQRVPRKKFENAFAMRGWERLETWSNLEKKHEPMGMALVSMLAHQPGQVQIGRCDFQAKLFLCFPAGALIWRFARFRVKFAPAGTPKAAVRFLFSFEQQNLILLIEAIEKGGNFVRQCHARGAA
jgi:hypothetical protein